MRIISKQLQQVRGTGLGSQAIKIWLCLVWLPGLKWWSVLYKVQIDIFPTLLGHFSTLVPIDNLWHYSAYTPKKSAFYANWFGNAKQLNEKWKILKKIHFFNSASAFFQLWLRMCFSKNPFPCVPFLWKNQLPIWSR